MACHADEIIFLLFLFFYFLYISTCAHPTSGYFLRYLFAEQPGLTASGIRRRHAGNDVQIKNLHLWLPIVSIF